MLDRRRYGRVVNETRIDYGVETCQIIAHDRTASLHMLPVPLVDVRFTITFDKAPLESRRCAALCGFDCHPTTSWRPLRGPAFYHYAERLYIHREVESFRRVDRRGFVPASSPSVCGAYATPHCSKCPVCISVPSPICFIVLNN